MSIDMNQELRCVIADLKAECALLLEITGFDAAEIARLRTELEALKADAARYRLLRESSCCLILEDILGVEADRNPQRELDQAIDAAMGAKL